jgi:hypothetical protein
MSGPTFARTPPQAAPWPKIHEGLRSLWKLSMPEHEGGDVARSLTINFVAVAAAADADCLRQAIDRLQTRTPCRAFLLLLDPASKPGPAELAAATRCHGSVRDIVLEEIALRLPPASLAQVPGLIRPLLMGDLPNHLYWAADWPTVAGELEALATLCDHLIVDSRRFRDPAAQLVEVHTRRQRGLRTTDLNWLRLRPWRRALAEALERVQFAPECKVTVAIEHAAAATASALLLGDWLRHRLGATVQTMGRDGNEAAPHRVTLRTADFEVELIEARQQIRVHVTTQAHCYLPFAIGTSRGSDADLLAAAIDLG